MKTIRMKTVSKSYPIVIGDSVLEKIPPFIDKHYRKCATIFVITDYEVARFHREAIERVLPKAIVHVVPNGENSKDMSTYHECLTACLEAGLNRDAVIIAFGGGMIGDLAGFVAATFMRGIGFIQVPTTLLAHDSAVGGKVAINHPLGKNLIGSFYQPDAVFYHLPFLDTLPKREWLSGFGEIIKHVFLGEESCLEHLQEEVQTVQDLNRSNLSTWIEYGIRKKMAFVAEDERESGKRQLLNLGHTLGHAIESVAGYGTYTHGEAVVIGLLFELQLSQKFHGLDCDLLRLRTWLEGLGYLKIDWQSLDIDLLLTFMQKDKKNRDQLIGLLILENSRAYTIKWFASEVVAIELKLFLEGFQGE